MLYFEDFLEGIDGLPNEVKLRLTEIRVLDLRAQNIVDQLNAKRESYFSKVETGGFSSEEERQRAQDALIRDNEELIRLSSEKESIAKRLHEKISKCCKKMHAELEKFKMELEADHPGVTDKIERDVLNLMSKGGSTHLRGERKRHRGRLPGRPGSGFSGFRSTQQASLGGSEEALPTSTAGGSAVGGPSVGNAATEHHPRLTVRIPVGPSSSGLEKKRSRMGLDSSLSPHDQEANSMSGSLSHSMLGVGSSGSGASSARRHHHHLGRGGSTSGFHLSPRTPTLVLTPARESGSFFPHGGPDTETHHQRRHGSVHKQKDTLSALIDQTDDEDSSPGMNAPREHLSSSTAGLRDSSMAGGSYSLYQNARVNATSPGLAHSLPHDQGHHGVATGEDLDEYGDDWAATGSSAAEHHSYVSGSPPHVSASSSLTKRRPKRTKHQNLHGMATTPSLSEHSVALVDMGDLMDTDVGLGGQGLASIEPEEDEPVFCTCRQVSYGEMVACDAPTCPYEWFHFDCVKLTAAPRGKWYCPNCRGRYQSMPAAANDDSAEDKGRKRSRKHRG